MRSAVFNLVYAIGITIVAPWLLWRFLFRGRYRRGLKEKLLGLVSPQVEERENETRIWLHAVSVGEVHLLKTLIDQLRTRFPESRIFISTTTESGYDRARELFAEQHQVFFWPTDFSWAVKNSLSRIRPDLVVLMELELWPNFLGICRARKIPVAVVNGRLSENSHAGYQKIRLLVSRSFQGLSLVLAQNQTYATRFRQLGCPDDCVRVTGNIKFDSLVESLDSIRESGLQQQAATGFAPEHRLFVAGSTQIEDERAAVLAYRELGKTRPNLRLILVPRHPQRRDEVLTLLQGKGLRGVLFSEQQKLDNAGPDDVLVIDAIGELTKWWSVAKVAFVGGAMGSRGGQNMIEPAAFGAPVCFGPNTRNFRETVASLLSVDASKVVHDANELEAFVDWALDDVEAARAMGARARQVVVANQGATKRTVEQLAELLGK